MSIANRLPRLHTKVLRDMESLPWKDGEYEIREKIEKKGKRSKESHFQNNGRKTKLNDSTILEIRALNQFCHWNYEMLMERYSLTRKDISRTCEYYNRTGLIPTKKDIPLILETK